jgi:hypothetical protein
MERAHRVCELERERFPTHVRGIHPRTWAHAAVRWVRGDDVGYERLLVAVPSAALHYREKRGAPVTVFLCHGTVLSRFRLYRVAVARAAPLLTVH